MAASNFDRALAVVLKHEGGFANDPRDPGGATNLGITRATLARARGRAVSVEEVRRLTRAEAAAIYRRSYWNAVRADELPGGLDLAVFDLAVNSGPARAARLLQRCLRCGEDGVVGPVTLSHAWAAAPAGAIRALSEARLTFLRKLPTWSAFGRGWTSRVQAVERSALAMAARPAASPPEPAAAAGPASPSNPPSDRRETMPTIPDLLGRIVADAIGDAAAQPAVPLQPGKAGAVADAVVKTIERDPRVDRITATDPKPWYASSTIWGVILSSALKIAALFVPWVNPGWADTIVQYAPLVLSFFGDATAVFGRARAKQPLK